MEKFVTVATFQYPQDAYVVKSKLESEGISCFLKDELTVQAHNFLSVATGGVKLQVFESEVERAIPILRNAGVIKDEQEQPSELFLKLDKWTSNIPLLRKASVELRLIFLAGTTITALILTVYFLTLP